MVAESVGRRVPVREVGGWGIKTRSSQTNVIENCCSLMPSLELGIVRIGQRLDSSVSDNVTEWEIGL